jgi:hypothetical protein
MIYYIIIIILIELRVLNSEFKELKLSGASNGGTAVEVTGDTSTEVFFINCKFTDVCVGKRE